MRCEIVEHILKSESLFSISIDESTSVANVQSLIVFARFLFDGSGCTYFLGLSPLSVAAAAAIYESSHQFMVELGLTYYVLKQQLVGFCSDGASNMVGQFSGVATILKSNCPLVKTFHCMAHRFELSIKDAVDNVDAVSHFRCFIDELYKVYGMSPKNHCELNSIASGLSIVLLKVKKVCDVRWAFSSYISLRAVLHDFRALYEHFSADADQRSGRSPKREKQVHMHILNVMCAKTA